MKNHRCYGQEGSLSKKSLYLFRAFDNMGKDLEKRFDGEQVEWSAIKRLQGSY